MSAISATIADSQRLDRIHSKIEATFPTLGHLAADELLDLSSRNDMVVFDVRELDEYRVSHIEGAIQVDPDIDSAVFKAEYGDLLRGRDVVFYCSVGQRSSELAYRVSDELISAGSGDIYNLRNGIFGWHNSAMPLVTDAADNPGVAQPTDYIHPFNWRWGHLLERRALRRYALDTP